MSPPSPTTRLRSLAAEAAWHLAPPLAYFGFMFRFYPFREEFWLGIDEGYNLIKGMLLFQGYPLYSQIWSDQPPLFTYLLAGLFRLAGFSVNAGRLLVLAMACLLLWAAVQYLRLAWGEWQALACIPLLILLPSFPVLSMAVVIGLPAVALAVVSLLGLAVWQRRRQPVWLALSGIALGLSVLVKLFTGFLAPIFVIGLIIAEAAHDETSYRQASYGQEAPQWGKRLRPALAWSLAFGATVLLLGLALVGPRQVVQLIQPHWAASRLDTYTVPLSDEATIHTFLIPSWPYLPLALLGAILAFRERRGLMLYPLAWMLVAYGMLAGYHPVWQHHQVLVTIPLAILAAGAAGAGLQGLAELVRTKRDPGPFGLLQAAAILGLALVFALRPQELAGQLERRSFLLQRPEGVSTEDRVMKKILEYAPETNWMVTDLPMYAFRAGLPIPPRLAVLSWKRLVSGNLTEAAILDELRQRRPEQVLLGRFEFPALEPYLNEGYFPIEAREDLTLYVRKDLLR